MGFSDKQIRILRKNVSSRHLRTRHHNGRELTYIEGWHAIDEANRIFGFDGWDRETVESRCVAAREQRGEYRALYVARVRVTVRADGASVVREGSGSGEGWAPSFAAAHDVALKAAETDATKRALATFGRPFGLGLYLSAPAQSRAESAPAAEPPRDHAVHRTLGAPSSLAPRTFVPEPWRASSAASSASATRPPTAARRTGVHSHRRRPESTRAPSLTAPFAAIATSSISPTSPASPASFAAACPPTRTICALPNPQRSAAR